MTDALLTNAGLLASAALLFWLLSVAIGKVSFVDAVWGGAMAALALASIAQVEAPGTMALLIVLMATAWGVRLAIHLLKRFLRQGEDPRYDKILGDDREKGRWWLAVGARVWLLQSVLIFGVSSPAQVGILAAGSQSAVPILGWIGLALWLVGIVFEWVGDWQLSRFKADPANTGKILDSGLWRYTRHPNYFGDACVWWGIWLVAMSVAPAMVIWTLPGPLFLTFTLIKWSGAAMTERGMREKHGDRYVDYVKRTSAFIPLPPRSA